MAQWTNADPGAGSLGQIDGSITNASSMATDIDNVLSSTTAAKNSVGPDLWSGSASVAWHAGAIGAMSNLPSMRNTLTTSISAMQAYRDAVSGIDGRASVWQSALDETVATIHEGQPFRWPWEGDLQKDDELKQERNLARHYLAIEKLQALGAEREAADVALVSALETALPSDWPAQHSAFVAAGLTDVDKITTEAALAAMEELAQNLVDGESGSNADVDAISALLDLYGKDEAAMSEFYQSFGGANTVALIDRIGAQAGNNTREAENLMLAQRIRSSLSVGSTDWDLETADDFAYDAFHGGADVVAAPAAALAYYGDVPNSRVAIVQDGRHDILNDVSHRSVAATIVLFLEELRNNAVPTLQFAGAGAAVR